MSYFIYIHTCPNGKRYIGQTTYDNPERRWGCEGYYYKRNKHFYQAIQKYGWSNIEHKYFEVSSKELMDFWEIALIHYYKTNDSNHGYNNSCGGEGGHRGAKHSEESKKKMSQWHKQKTLSEDHKKHISESLRKIMKDVTSYKCRKILCIQTGEIFNGAEDIAVRLGISKMTIYRLCNGTYCKDNYKGFGFRYI